MSLKHNLLKILSVVAILAMLISNFSMQVAQAQQAENGEGIKRKVNAESHRISFIGPESGRVLPAAKALGTSIRPQDPAMALAKKYGPEFGLNNPERDLSVMKKKHENNGRSSVRYQQKFNGVPVMGGELIVNMDDDGNLYSMNGEVSPNLTLDTKPTVDAKQARATALQAMAKWYEKKPEDFTVTEPELWVFDESLLQPSTRPAELVWRMEVSPKDQTMPIRELMLVNAQTNSISFRFNEIDTAWTAITRRPLGNAAIDTANCPLINGTLSVFNSYKPYVVHNCSLNGYGVGIGDFNNDGKKDVAFSGVNYGSGPIPNSLLIYLQDINGDLSQPMIYPIGNIAEPLAVGDFNHDSRDDVVLWDSSALSVYLQTSNGVLAAPITYPALQPDGIAVGDINNDGRDDIVLSHWGLNSISVLTQKTDGTLNPVVSYPSIGEGYGDIDIGDVNGDGLNDVVKMNGQGNFADAIIVHTQNSSHTLNSYTTNYTSGMCPSSCAAGGIAVGDVTGDGKADIVMSYSIFGSTFLAVFKQASNGNLLLPVSYSSSMPVPVEIADMNSDGLLDVVTSNYGAAGVHLQQNNGTLSQASYYNLISGNPHSQSLAISDINNDGKQDILSTSGLGLEILYQRSPLINGGNRLTYTANHQEALPGDFLCDQTNPFCTDFVNSDADAAHFFAGGTWNLYRDKYNRNSIDNNGMTIVSTVDYRGWYENAYWSGTQMVYGDGYSMADDVVAHELTHGVTQYESNLFYYYQSGAINESLSDVFGEYYDQTDHDGNDGTNVKWLLGEDLSSSSGLRSMSNPPAYGDPDKMSSPNYQRLQYYDNDWDNGGVHTNSGINNKAVYLMVDGDTFNGKTVTRLGWDKVGAIYYEANTNLLTSGADYSDLYYALQQACMNLSGQKGITSADCAQVKNALDAVEMDQPVPGFSNWDAPFCDGGTTAIPFFVDDLENGLGNWIINNGSYLHWQYDSPYGQYAQSGNHFLYADDYPQYQGVPTDARATLTSFYVPANAYLWFAQAYEFEYQTSTYDGGVLEFSINNGSTWVDAGPLMQSNGYNGMIFSNYINPLQGRSAFVGSSHGYISTRVNLSSLAGNTVRFRWRMGLDDYGMAYGWAVDNVRAYTCGTVNIISGNVGAPGVVLSYYDGTVETATSDLNGNYSLSVSNNWSGTITPSHPCYSFNPPNRSYSNMTTNKSGESYSATFNNPAQCAVTVGVFRPSNGALYLKNSNTTGYADVQINYGVGGDYPITGDWDGDGTDTIGIYRNGAFYLRNSNTIGFADNVFAFGAPGDQPVAGDWDGDGIDTIGVYRSSNFTFYLRNSNSSGAPEMIFSLGIPGDKGIAGDWDGDGMDTTGVFRPSNGALYLKNTNVTGYADVQINYGVGGDLPVTGDWNNDGVDTIGVYRNGAFYLRNSNTIGYADMVFALGVPGDMPIAGNWDAVP